jgi:hypothetical protein
MSKGQKCYKREITNNQMKNSNDQVKKKLKKWLWKRKDKQLYKLSLWWWKVQTWRQNINDKTQDTIWRLEVVMRSIIKMKKNQFNKPKNIFTQDK